MEGLSAMGDTLHDVHAEDVAGLVAQLTSLEAQVALLDGDRVLTAFGDGGVVYDVDGHARVLERLDATQVTALLHAFLSTADAVEDQWARIERARQPSQWQRISDQLQRLDDNGFSDTQVRRFDNGGWLWNLIIGCIAFALGLLLLIVDGRWDRAAPALFIGVVGVLVGLITGEGRRRRLGRPPRRFPFLRDRR